MNKNLQISLLILIIIASGVFILYSLTRSKSPPALSTPAISQEQQMQNIIKSTSASGTSTPLSAKEKQQLINSTSASKAKTSAPITTKTK